MVLEVIVHRPFVLILDSVLLFVTVLDLNAVIAFDENDSVITHSNKI